MADPISRSSPESTEQILLRMHEMMFVIRCVDERIRQEYGSRSIRGPVHLSIGQEAIAVGVLMACRPSDCCVSTHRGHAHYLAKGGDLQGIIDEFYGLDTGCCKGRGGSMHLFNKEAGFWGSSAVVGGSIPVAAGVAFALKHTGTDGLCIGFCGDGATDEGAFYETLNLAALLRLPVLFVVENNGLSTNSPLKKRQFRSDVVTKARAFGVEGITADGNDVVAVYEVTSELVSKIRSGPGPFLLEAVTERLCAHVGPVIYAHDNVAADSTLASKLEREPLKVFRRYIEREYPGLREEGVVMEKRVLEEVDHAFERAKERFATQLALASLPPPPPPDPSRV